MAGSPAGQPRWGARPVRTERTARKEFDYGFTASSETPLTPYATPSIKRESQFSPRETRFIPRETATIARESPFSKRGEPFSERETALFGGKTRPSTEKGTVLD